MIGRTQRHATMQRDLVTPPRQQREVVLVPLDGSPAGATILPVAEAIARVLNAMVHLVCPAGAPFDELLSSANLRSKMLRGKVIHQVDEPLTAALLRLTQEWVRGMIATSTHRRVLEAPRVLDELAQEVLLSATCPVLFLRPELGPRFANFKGPRRILLPLDGVPSTAGGLVPAVELVRRSGAELDVLHVVVTGKPRCEEKGTLTTPRYVDSAAHEWVPWTQEFLNRFCYCLGQCPSTVKMRLFMGAGDPGQEILRIAEERRSDLIILVWRGRLDLDHAITAQAVLRGAQCPTLFLRAVPAL